MAFVIDTIITIPIGIIGFFVLPGTPNKCYSLFLSDEEIYLARDRLRRANIASESHGPDFLTKSSGSRLFRTGGFTCLSCSILLAGMQVTLLPVHIFYGSSR